MCGPCWKKMIWIWLLMDYKFQIWTSIRWKRKAKLYNKSVYLLTLLSGTCALIKSQAVTRSAPTLGACQCWSTPILGQDYHHFFSILHRYGSRLQGAVLLPPQEVLLYVHFSLFSTDKFIFAELPALDQYNRNNANAFNTIPFTGNPQTVLQAVPEA